MIAEAALEIEAIEAVEPAPGLVWRLDAPRPDERSDAFAIELRGWIAVSGAPPLALEVEAGGDAAVRLALQAPARAEASRTPEGAERRRFSASLGTLDLPDRFALRIAATFEGGERRLLGEIRGRQGPLLVEPSALAPVLVSGLGRSGSTWLVHLLGRHPQLAAYRPFRQEPRVLGWWIEALRAISSPSSQSAMLAPQGFPDTWWLGDESRPPRLWHDEAIRALLLGDGPRRAAILARERVEAFYGAVAELEGKRARAFVEKGPGSLDRGAWNLASKLFPTVHEVLLLRDPRDVACSTVAYTRRNPGAVLGPPGATLDGLAAWAAEEMVERLRLARERGRAASVVRYEELVADPARSLTPVLEALGFEPSAAIVAEMVDSATRLATDATPLHATSSSPGDSVGRWRRELPGGGPAEVVPLIEELGY